MNRPLLPQAVAEPMPSGSAHTSAASASTNPSRGGRGRNQVTVLALGSERSNGRPPDEPTPGQRAREQRPQASRHGGSGDSAPPEPTDNGSGIDNKDKAGWLFMVGLLIIIIVAVVAAVRNKDKDKSSSGSSYGPWPTPWPTPYPTPRPTPRPSLPPAQQCRDIPLSDGLTCPRYFCGIWTEEEEVNCCICGGGQKTCTDTPNWTDAHWDGCGWYVDRPSSCDDYAGTMGPASENCCVCGGGDRSTVAPTPTALTHPTPKPSTDLQTGTVKPSLTPTHPTSKPSTDVPCKDTPNWVDSGADGCDWYVDHSSTCDVFTGTMGPASKNCCVCGGGDKSTVAPTPTDPTPKPSTGMTTGARTAKTSLASEERVSSNSLRSESGMDETEE